MQNGANKLRQYITRCLKDKKPSQGKLISIFLEGLRNKTLHAHLYAIKHKTLRECYLDAMDYDDNFELLGSEKRHYGMDVDQVSLPTLGMEKDLSQEIANLVLKGLNQQNRGGTPTATRTNVPIQRPFLCGVVVEPILREAAQPFNLVVQTYPIKNGVIFSLNRQIM